MVSRKSMNIYIPKYFMAVRNGIPGKCFSSLLIKDTSLLTCLYIGELRNGWKFNARINPSSYLFYFLEGFCFRFFFFLIQFELTTVGMNST